jgi:hypothetical protein
LVAAEHRRVTYNEHRRNPTFEEAVRRKEIARLWKLTDKGAASVKKCYARRSKEPVFKAATKRKSATGWLKSKAKGYWTSNKNNKGEEH